MHYTYLLLMLVFAALACACIVAERKSRKWYQDRLMLQFSGFFAALSLVAFGFFLYYA